MEDEKIQYYDALRPLKRDQHHILLFCFRVRDGLLREVPVSRIKKYSDWFYGAGLKAHLEFSQANIFSMEAVRIEIRQTTEAIQMKLASVFEEQCPSGPSLEFIEKELDHYIRLEENQLACIERLSTGLQLAGLEQRGLGNMSSVAWPDKFWLQSMA